MYRFIKRALDILLSLAGLLLLWPLLLILAILIRIDSPGPAIFKQVRLGKDGKEFTMHKFRTMCQNAEGTGSGVYSMKGDPRVTRMGKILRLGFDELPQLWDILRGKMSFVGPRPPLTYHPWSVDRYTPEQFKMFSVRPGITGWAQVNGRKAVEWNRRIEMNVWYTEHMSLWLDLKILFMTVGSVLGNKDNANVEKTADEASEVHK
ncbi:MAG: sugar transferase [Ruminococcaceae bacterium]|nr:sugar transferase [Oscillospiraceae bacterium]